MKKIDQAKSIAAKLSKISQNEGVAYQNIATTFLLERLLARLLSNSRLVKCLVFKGGYVGLRVYNSARYTIDLDALLVKADVSSTMRQTVEVIESDIDDGVWFKLESEIDLKTQGEYGGVRQTFRAGLGEIPEDIKRAQIINFDVGIGDPVIPAPIKTTTEEFIGNQKLSWQVYPIETIVAEKLQTLVVRGHDNSRAKDVYDLHYYLPKVDGRILEKAIEKCFAFRGTSVPENLVNALAKIERSTLKRGWSGATVSLKNPPSFEEAFESIIIELERIFSSKTEATKRAKK